MNKTAGITLALGAALMLPLGAQPTPLHATLYANGSATEGKCVVEVAVSGAADLEIRGDNVVLRNGSGARPEWGRFECTGRVPDYPIDLRVRNLAGRGNV